MSFRVIGPHRWSGSRDAEGYREWTLQSHVVTTDPNDGPALAMQTPGLPIPGSIWNFGNDIDVWAWCRWDCTVEPYLEGEPNLDFMVTNRFSTKPPGVGGGAGAGGRGGGGAGGSPSDNKRSGCRDFQFEDPLTEPDRKSTRLNSSHRL